MKSNDDHKSVVKRFVENIDWELAKRWIGKPRYALLEKQKSETFNMRIYFYDKNKQEIFFARICRDSFIDLWKIDGSPEIVFLNNFTYKELGLTKDDLSFEINCERVLFVLDE